MEKGTTILCGANAYEKKYYFNPAFAGIPESVQEELHIICVLFTEEAGGILTIGFDTEGEVFLETNAAEDDFAYDDITSGLLVREIRRNRQELMASLRMYYRVFILRQDLTDD